MIPDFPAMSRGNPVRFRVFCYMYFAIGSLYTDLKKEEAHDWANYPKGVLKVMRDAGYPVDAGMDIVYFGNIPNSSGLSSYPLKLLL